jgi:translation initiation factor 1
MPEYSRTVYTSEGGRFCPECAKPVGECVCKKKPAARPAGDGVVRVGLEKKQRGGKTVSVISGLRLAPEALRELASELKRRCGTGGTVKEDTIEIQGDHRETILAVLKEHGYPAKKAGG